MHSFQGDVRLTQDEFMRAIDLGCGESVCRDLLVGAFERGTEEVFEGFEDEVELEMGND